jgi:cellulose synthase/poly-beta-1,6-N-acetylglucosamine synthase-like glycosyltransferase
MVTAIILFWASFFILTYCYCGYGILLFLINKIKRLFLFSIKQKTFDDPIPVTLIVAAYNESDVLEAKIKNSLALDYPGLNILFVTDGSNDGSNEIAQRYPSITLLHHAARKGKFAAIKRAIQFVQTPIVIFSDANSMLNKNCIQKIASHYHDPKVGGVAGEKKILHYASTIGEAESLYWKYESFMKKQDADFNTVVGAAGELFSIRTALFNEFEDDIILDDFIISMKICLQGYRIEYEPEAFAIETPSTSLNEEEKRKVRISAGAFQSVAYLKNALNFLKYPLLSFQYISRRLLRWMVCPLLLAVVLLANIFIVSHATIEFYKWTLNIQLFFYGMALLGWFFVRTGWRTGILNVPFYFVFMNYCLIKGFFIFLNGNHTVLWKKSLRLQPTAE